MVQTMTESPTKVTTHPKTEKATGKKAATTTPVEKAPASEPEPVANAQLTADDFDDSGADEAEDMTFDGPQSLVQRLVDHQGDDADKYDYADTYEDLTGADELVESNEQAYDG